MEYADLLDVALEAEVQPLDATESEFDAAVESSVFRGEKVIRIWVTANFGYVKTENNLYRC